MSPSTLLTTMRGGIPLALGIGIAIARAGLEEAPGADTARSVDPAIFETVLTLIAIVITALGAGVGLGCFGLTIGAIFRRRTEQTVRVMRARPALSTAIGTAITIVGLGVLAIFEGREVLQLMVFVAYLVALLLFAGGAAVRLAANWIEPSATPDVAPDASACVKAGLVLVLLNVVPVLGTIVFCGIALCGVGATLVTYFASMGGAAVAVARTAEPPPLPPKE